MASWCLLALHLAMALILIMSGVGKATNSSSFQSALSSSGFPRWATTVLAIGLPAVEIIIGGGLLFGNEMTTRLAAVSAVVLFLAFTVWIAIVLMNGKRVSCGCFGSTVSEVSWKSLLRNLLLISAASIATALHSITATPTIPFTPEGFAVTVGLILIIALVIVLRFGRPALDLSPVELDSADS